MVKHIAMLDVSAAAITAMTIRMRLHAAAVVVLRITRRCVLVAGTAHRGILEIIGIAAH